jgi:hypothetical protein
MKVAEITSLQRDHSMFLEEIKHQRLVFESPLQVKGFIINCD